MPQHEGAPGRCGGVCWRLDFLVLFHQWKNNEEKRILENVPSWIVNGWRRNNSWFDFEEIDLWEHPFLCPDTFQDTAKT